MSKARTRPLAAFFPFYANPALKLDLRTSARSPKPPSAVNTRGSPAYRLSFCAVAKLCVQTGLATAFPLTSQLAAKPLQSAGDVIALETAPFEHELAPTTQQIRSYAIAARDHRDAAPIVQRIFHDPQIIGRAPAPAANAINCPIETGASSRHRFQFHAPAPS